MTMEICLCRALEKTGLDPEEVNYVNAHATSTPAGDMAEYKAIRSAIPHKHLRMNATKSMTGHLLGAAGAIEAIASVQAIQTGETYCHKGYSVTAKLLTCIYSECGAALQHLPYPITRSNMR